MHVEESWDQDLVRDLLEAGRRVELPSVLRAEHLEVIARLTREKMLEDTAQTKLARAPGQLGASPVPRVSE